MLLIFAFLFTAELKFIQIDELNLAEHDIYTLNSVIRDIAIAPDGRTAILDPSENQVVLFAHDGEFVKRLGRKGQGPGEFQRFGQIEWLVAEEVWVVMDWGNARISKWSIAGELQSEIKAPLLNTGGSISVIDHQKMIYSDFIYGAFGANPQIYSYRLDQAESKQLYEHSLSKATQVFRPDDSIVLICDWDPTLVFAVGSDFIVTAFAAESEIRLLNFDGKLLGKPIHLDLKQYPITDADILKQKERLPVAHGNTFIAKYDKPETWPFISHITVDPQDRIWVFASKRYTKHFPVMVFNKSGNKLAEGLLRQRPAQITEQYLYNLRGNADDELVLKKIKYEFE